MTVETKIHIVRVALWIASIFVVTWPLHLARPAIGDIAYVASCAIVWGASTGCVSSSPSAWAERVKYHSREWHWHAEANNSFKPNPLRGSA